MTFWEHSVQMQRPKLISPMHHQPGVQICLQQVLWQTIERLNCDLLNGMKHFGSALLVELVDANAPMPFESFLIEPMPPWQLVDIHKS